MSRLGDLGDILGGFEGRKYVPEKTNGRYKNLYLIIDSSGSITPDKFEEIKKGGRKAIKQLPEDGYCAVMNFSDACLYSGWVPKDSALQEGEHVLETLDTYIGRGSCLDANALTELKCSQTCVKGEIAVLFVTDGHFSSFQGVPEVFKELEEKGYCLGLVDLDGSNGDIPEFEAIYTPKNNEEIAAAMANFAIAAFFDQT